jgi:hypothetical protein
VEAVGGGVSVEEEGAFDEVAVGVEEGEGFVLGEGGEAVLEVEIAVVVA